MKKILIILLIVLNIILVRHLLFRPYFYDATYLSIDYFNKTIKQPFKSDAEILLLGDSTIAFGLKTNRIENSFMLAMPTASSLVLYLQLQRYFKNNQTNNVKCFVVGTSYSNDFHYHKEFWPMLVGTGFITDEELDEVYQIGKDNGVFPSEDVSEISYFIQKFYYRYLTFNGYKQHALNEYLDINQEGVTLVNQLKAEIELQKGFLSFVKDGAFVKRNMKYLNNYMEDDYRKQMHRFLFQRYSIDKTEDYYFKKIVELSKKYNSKIIFLETPVNTQDNRVVQFRENHIQNIAQLLKENPNHEILRFNRSFSTEFFKDLTHLNAKGAEVFTNLFAEKIVQACGTNQ